MLDQIFRKNQIRLIIASLLAFAIVFSTPAQDITPAEVAEEQTEPTVAEKIMEESEGNVEIIIDDELMERIMEPPHGKPKQRHQNRIRSGLNKIRGYRIQVFNDGRNQSSLESRAKARGSAIAAKFPKYRGQVYTYSSAPNWITRVGNFRTSGEASEALSELKRAFPSFAGEMRIVNSDIYVIR